MSAPTVNAAPVWEDLLAREPRLADLLAEAQAISSRGNPYFCANEVWFGFDGFRGLKPRLLSLAGWQAESRDPVLWSTRAYHVAYETIYNSLPSCRECGCL